MTQILSTLEYAFGIITLLGGVIAVHELGHFLMAKWAGARVDVFSIGFGPRLFTKKWGETEYCLSVIPLGGYVKIYGQDPEEISQDENPQPERSLAHKPLLPRLGVFVGGPAFNYFLAILIFSFMAIVGIEKFPSIATRVVTQSPAHSAGLRSGDHILAINNKSVNSFEEIMMALMPLAEQNAQIQIERNGKNLVLQVPIQKENTINQYGEPIKAGYLQGVSPIARTPIVATGSQKSIFSLQNGDKILSVAGNKVRSWEDLEAYIANTWPKLPNPLSFQVIRNNQEITVTSSDLKSFLQNGSARWSTDEVLAAAGVYSQELVIKEVLADQPAGKAGLKSGDRIISINKNKVYSFEGLRASIQAAGEKQVPEIELVVDRAGTMQTLRSTLTETKSKDPLGKVILTYTIGIKPLGIPQKPEQMLLERTFNPAKALWLGSKETWNQTVSTVVGIKKLIFGEVSLKSVGGPIMIGKIAGETLSDRGWRDFLRIMAIISISLGVFNLLPIPILDGGHVVFAIIESIRGKPVSPAATQIALKVGMSLLLLLMVFAVFNDLTKVLPF